MMQEKDVSIEHIDIDIRCVIKTVTSTQSKNPTLYVFKI